MMQIIIDTLNNLPNKHSKKITNKIRFKWFQYIILPKELKKIKQELSSIELTSESCAEYIINYMDNYSLLETFKLDPYLQLKTKNILISKDQKVKIVVRHNIISDISITYKENDIVTNHFSISSKSNNQYVDRKKKNALKYAMDCLYRSTEEIITSLLHV